MIRWLNIDPLADLRQGLSPYNYCQNNPLVRIDPTGMLDENWVTSTIAGVQGRMGMNNIIDGTTVTVNGDDEKEKNSKKKESMSTTAVCDNTRVSIKNIFIEPKVYTEAQLKAIEYYNSLDHSFSASMKRFFTAWKELSKSNEVNNEFEYWNLSYLGYTHYGWAKSILTLSYIDWVQKHPEEAQKHIAWWVNYMKKVSKQ